MSDPKSEIEALTKKIDAAIAEGQQAVGREKEIRERLDKDYGIKDPSQIQSVIERLKEEQASLEEKVNSGLKRLREKYNFG